MGGRKQRQKTPEPPITSTSGEQLKVLIIGGTGAIEEAPRILESVTLMELNLTLIGVALLEPLDLPKNSALHKDISLFGNYEEAIQQTQPDLVILTVDDRKILKRLLRILPPRARVLDAFSMQVFRTLRRVSGLLGTTEKKVRNLELIKDVLTSGSSVSIMVVDEDFKVLDIDNAVSQRIKISREGCIGRGCHWLIHRRMEPCHERGGECPATEVIRTGRSTHRVSVQQQEDGKRRYFTISGYPLGADERGKKCVLIVWKDVTKGLTPLFDQQVKALKANFSRMLHQDKMAALGKLAAAAVHEINNPLQGILTFSKLMRSNLDHGALTPETIDKFRSYLDLISGESARCGKILKSLLSFARLDGLQRNTFDLNPVLDELLLLVSNRMELQEITFRREVPVPFLLYGDRNQIKQVLLNLVLNAVEAMPEGGDLGVSANVSEATYSTKISVSDTGRGIDQSVRGSILEPFVTTKDAGHGVGLGLSMVYGIVTQHGGSMEIDSAENKGTTFVVSLPIDLPPRGEE